MDAKERYAQWRARELEDEDLTAELAAIEGNETEIYERFYTDLVFGTAGLRGILGAGTNRMNVYTVRRATQGLARYVRQLDEFGSAAIAYDSRNKSERFAKEAASVLAANGVRVYLYPTLAPTPMLSWAVRAYGCTAGIVVTASHNPAAYNGYKVYGADGCQMTSEAADAVYRLIEQSDLFEDVLTVDFEESVELEQISMVSERVIADYEQAVLACRQRPGLLAESDLSVVYTPLNGSGNLPVRRVLAAAGLRRLTVVPEQELPDGNFPTCGYPNPELPEAMALGVALTERLGADLLIGTDPDSDRVGVGVAKNGRVTLLSGNEVGVLLTDYIGSARTERHTMPERPILVKSIVSTPLADLVAAHYGIETVNVLTGFKYIGETILHLEQQGEQERFVFGFEESCGYLPAGYVRDKDGVSAALLIAEMAAWHKSRGRTLLDVLEELYRTFGYFYHAVTNTAFAGSDGMRKMGAMMDALFAAPPRVLGTQQVVEYHDLRHSVAVRDAQRSPIALPPSEVMMLFLEQGGTVIIRPSGTEPKLKVYVMVKGASMAEARALASALCAAVNARLGL